MKFHSVSVKASNLADAEVVPRDVEFLEVGIEQLFDGFVRAAAGGEHLAAERL